MAARALALVRNRDEDRLGEPPGTAIVWLALGLARPGGLVLAIKGAGAEDEVAQARPELRRLGARDVTVLRVGGGKVNRAATVVRLIAGGH